MDSIAFIRDQAKQKRSKQKNTWEGVQDSIAFLGSSVTGKGARRRRITEICECGGNGSEYRRIKADFIFEMRHLAKVRHPCITTLMGAVIEKKEEPMIVMEYMVYGSLYEILHNDTVVLEGEVLIHILRDITKGMRFLHEASPQVVHGDLKAQNVLVGENFRAKVADFGLGSRSGEGSGWPTQGGG